MKNRKLRCAIFGLAAAAGLIPTGCSHTEAGAGTGAVGGAIVGSALAGRGKGAQGALIGAGAGAIAGGLIGNSVDRQEKREMQAAAARMLSVQDVISLSQSNTPPNVIIDQIRTTGSVYTLTANDLRVMQESGVNAAVVREMQYSGSRRVVPVGRPVYVEERPVVIMRPAPPPPPPAFGVGVMIRP